MNWESVREGDNWICTIPIGNTSLDSEDLFLSFARSVFLSFLSSLVSSVSLKANLWIGIAQFSRPVFSFLFLVFYVRF